MKGYISFKNRNPVIFRFNGKRERLDGLTVRPDKEYFCEYKGDTLNDGKLCMMVEITPNKVSYKKATKLYQGMGSFMMDWLETC